MTPERHETLFDRHAVSYARELEDAVAFSGQDADFFAQAKVELLSDLIRERLGDAAGVKLLDVGCGAGAMHRRLADAGVLVTGVDVASRQIEIARAANPFARYEVVQDRRLPFADASFDFAMTICVLHHVAAQDQPLLVAEMARVTRRGGLIAVIEHNPLNPLTRLAVWRCPFDEDAVLLPARRSRALLQAAAGKAATRYFLFFPFRQRWSARLERRLAWLGMGAQYCAYAVNGS